jgi:hypothetical protein
MDARDDAKGAEVIDPKPGDEGRIVIYARLDPHRKTERGVISSWNEHVVFVRYTIGSTGAATLREDLEWESDAPAGTAWRDRT